MNILVIFILIVVLGIAIWQGALFVRDLIKFIKKKKAQKTTKNDINEADNSARKE